MFLHVYINNCTIPLISNRANYVVRGPRPLKRVFTYYVYISQLHTHVDDAILLIHTHSCLDTIFNIYLLYMVRLYTD